MTDLLMNMLSDKKATIKFLLQTIENNDKYAKGLRSIKSSTDLENKVDKLIDVVSNQSVQIKHIALLSLIHIQSESFDSDLAKMLSKFGKGDEALRQMFKNKFGDL